MKAIWFSDYDSGTGKLYKRPGCPKCREPIRLDKDGNYRCNLCGEVVKIEDGQVFDWLAKKSEEKVSIEDDQEITTRAGKIGCNGKRCVETHWIRNAATLEWQIAYGRCKNCGARFIV